MASYTKSESDPDQGHLQRQDWANDVGGNRLDIVNSIKAGTGEQLLNKGARARVTSESPARNLGLLSQDPCGSGVSLGPLRE